MSQPKTVLAVIAVVTANLLSDIRLAFRTLTRSPGFSTVTIVLIALGIAATTTLFSLTYGVLLKPLPWPDPDRVVRLQEMRGGNAGRVPWTITNTTYHAWREQPATIEAVGGWLRPQVVNATVGAGAPEPLRLARVTPSLFATLGVPPVRGRALSEDDLTSGRGAIVLAFHAWQRRFGGREDILGQTLRVDGRNLRTIVGVMPAHFEVPVAGLVIGVTAASALAQWLSGFLFGVTPRDAATFTAIPLFLLLAAAAACVVPAYRAARVNPIIALRSS